MVLSVASYHTCIRACFSTDGVCCGFGSAHPFVTFGGSGGTLCIMFHLIYVGYWR